MIEPHWNEAVDFLPGVFDRPVTLAANDDGTVAIVPILVYPTGIAFDVITIAHNLPDDPPFDIAGAQVSLEPGPTSATFLTLRVQYEDGRCATNLLSDPDLDKPPLFASTQSSFARGRAIQRYWLSPLPDGDLTISCEWPIFSLTGSHTLPGALIKKALEAAVEV